jgi:acyl carrier protein
MSEHSHNEIIARLESIFHEVFENQSITLEDSTTADDIDGWDSLTNIRLLIHIEQEFSISFNSVEIADIPNVGELASLIGTRI